MFFFKLDSADYSRSKSNFSPPPNQEQNFGEMRTPGVVARLMGLSSMPAATHQTPTKLGDHRDAGSQDWSGTSRSIYTSPQKQQKTERLIVDRRHGNASQFSAPDRRPSWPRRHAHKIASPVKSPRSISSRNKARLLEAAAKVLEPGLQSRNSRGSRRHAYLGYSSCNGGDGAPGAAAVLHNFSGQFSADMRDVDAPVFGAHDTGVTSLHNSNQCTEEVGKCTIPVKRSDQSLSCQMQPERNGKCPYISLSEKPVFDDSIQRTTNCVSVTNQDIGKNQQKNMSPVIVSGGPLKQNNQKHNALPAPCRAADPEYTTQRLKLRSKERNATNPVQDFVSLNKRMTSSTSLRSKRKVMDRIGESHTTAENKTMSTKGPQTSSQHSGSPNKLKTITASHRAMEKDMIIAKGAGLVSEKPKSASPSCARSGLQRHVESQNVSRCNKKSDIISFPFSSSRKVVPTFSPGDNASRTGSAVKRHSLFERKSAISVTVESLGDEQQWQSNLEESVTLCLSKPSKQVQLHETHKVSIFLFLVLNHRHNAKKFLRRSI
jgi:hypothetical protein